MIKHAFFLLTIIGIMNLSFGQSSLEDAKNMYKSGQLTQAFQLLENLAEKDRKNPEITYWKGLVAMEMGDLEVAKAAFKSGNLIRIPYPYHEVGMARVLFKENQRTLAKQKLAQILEEQINISYDLKLAIAEAYLEGKESGEGKVLLYQLQADRPDDPRSYILLGDYYWQIKAAQHAIGQYEEAIKLAPDHVPAYVRMGQLLIEEKRYNEGLEKLNKAIELDPQYADAYRYKGELYAKAQKFEEARDNYQQYLNLTQNDLRAQDLYGAFLFMCEDYEGVIKTYTSLENKAYASSRMHRLKGYTYFELGEPEKAKNELDSYFSRIDEYFALADDYEYYAKTLLALGADERADRYFAKAIKKDPTRIVIYEKLADTYKKEKAFDKEVKYRKLFLENIKPTAKSLQKLGIAYYHAKDYEAAAQTFEELDNIAPNQTLVYVWQARVVAKMDTSETQTQVVPAAQKIVDFLDKKLAEKGELSTWELNQFGTYGMFLAHQYYQPNEEGIGNCLAAKPYVDRLIELGENYEEIASMENFEYIKSLSEYCSQ